MSVTRLLASLAFTSAFALLTSLTGLTGHIALGASKTGQAFPKNIENCQDCKIQFLLQKEEKTAEDWIALQKLVEKNASLPYALTVRASRVSDCGRVTGEAVARAAEAEIGFNNGIRGYYENVFGTDHILPAQPAPVEGWKRWCEDNQKRGYFVYSVYADQMAFLKQFATAGKKFQDLIQYKKYLDRAVAIGDSKEAYELQTIPVYTNARGETAKGEELAKYILRNQLGMTPEDIRTLESDPKEKTKYKLLVTSLKDGAPKSALEDTNTIGKYEMYVKTKAGMFKELADWAEHRHVAGRLYKEKELGERFGGWRNGVPKSVAATVGQALEAGTSDLRQTAGGALSMVGAKGVGQKWIEASESVAPYLQSSKIDPQASLLNPADIDKTWGNPTYWLYNGAKMAPTAALMAAGGAASGAAAEALFGARLSEGALAAAESAGASPEETLARRALERQNMMISRLGGSSFNGFSMGTMNASSVWSDCHNKGLSDEQCSKRAAGAFYVSFALATPSAAMGVFSKEEAKTMSAITRSMGVEFVDGFAQQAAVMKIQGNPKVFEGALDGALMYGALGAAQRVGVSGLGRLKSYSPEQIKGFSDRAIAQELDKQQRLASGGNLQANDIVWIRDEKTGAFAPHEVVERLGQNGVLKVRDFRNQVTAVHEADVATTKPLKREVNLQAPQALAEAAKNAPVGMLPGKKAPTEREIMTAVNKLVPPASAPVVQGPTIKSGAFAGEPFVNRVLSNGKVDLRYTEILHSEENSPSLNRIEISLGEKTVSPKELRQSLVSEYRARYELKPEFQEKLNDPKTRREARNASAAKYKEGQSLIKVDGDKVIVLSTTEFPVEAIQKVVEQKTGRALASVADDVPAENVPMQAIRDEIADETRFKGVNPEKISELANEAATELATENAIVPGTPDSPALDEAARKTFAEAEKAIGDDPSIAPEKKAGIFARLKTRFKDKEFFKSFRRRLIGCMGKPKA